MGAAWVRTESHHLQQGAGQELRGQTGPCPSHPIRDKKEEARQQFMRRKADWLIHCQGHVSQQR